MDINTIHNIDCLDGLKQLKDNSVDLIITDPPYNISQKNHNIDRTKMNSPIMRAKSPLVYDFGDWDNMDREEFLEFTSQWMKECCRVLKENGTIISFFNKEDISYLGWEAEKYGIRTRTIFTWCKSNPTPSFRKENYLSGTEYIWIGSKGKWTFNFKYQSQMKNYMITSNASSYKETNHPTEKPLDLIEYFIEIHSNKGELVLDIFNGSGTTSIASKKLRRNFIGFEKNKEHYDTSIKRLEKFDEDNKFKQFEVINKLPF